MFKVVSGGVCSRVYTVTLLWPGDGHYAFFVVVRVLRNVRSFKPTGGPPPLVTTRTDADFPWLRGINRTPGPGDAARSDLTANGPRWNVRRVRTSVVAVMVVRTTVDSDLYHRPNTPRFTGLVDDPAIFDLIDRVSSFFETFIPDRHETSNPTLSLQW